MCMGPIPGGYWKCKAFLGFLAALCSCLATHSCGVRPLCIRPTLLGILNATSAGTAAASAAALLGSTNCSSFSMVTLSLYDGLLREGGG